MLLLIFFLGAGQRILDHGYNSVITVWVSKYFYHGNKSQIAYHNKLLLGISHSATALLGPLMGIFFDKCGELVVAPLIFFVAAAPYFWLYFLQDFDSSLGYTLQIITAIAAILTNPLNMMMLARHSPTVGAGKIYAMRSVLVGLVSIGYNYAIGWVLDQSFNRAAFLVCGVVGSLVVLAFFLVACCCKRLSNVPDEFDEE